MNWNNEKLNEIQAIEDSLIYSANCGSSSKLFTSFMHSTSEWIDRDYQHKKVHISPFKVELDKQVDMVAYHIECGYTVNISISMIGKNWSDFRKNLTDTHKRILVAARKQRNINKLKNDSLKAAIKYRKLNNINN
jgi:hypothetical protein